MGNLKDNNNQDSDNAQILKLVKRALNEAELLEQFVIGERKEGFMLKPKIHCKEEKIKAFESLAERALTAGDDVNELIKMANRE